MSVNKVILIGNLGQDPDLRYTGNNTPVASLSIATTERWMKDGEKQEQTEWHRVVAWGKTAEHAAKYLSKGRQVYIEGKNQTRSWEDKEGQKRYTTEVVAQNIQFLGKMEGNRPPHPADEQQQPSAAASEPSAGAPPMGETPGIDDIPF